MFDALRITTIQDITNHGSSSSPNSIQSTKAFKFAIFGYFTPNMYYTGGCLLNNMISTSFDKGIYISSYTSIYAKKSSDGKTLYWYASSGVGDNDHIYTALIY